MGTLTAEQIVRGIKEGRPLTALTIDDALLDRYVEEAISEDINLGSRSPDVLRLFESIREQLIFIDPDRRDALSKCEVFVLPFPLCISYSWEIDNRKIIVIGKGLIDLVANTLLASYVQSLLPPDLDEYFLPKFRKDMSAGELFANSIFLLQVHFYRFGYPLPDLQAAISPELLSEAEIGINGALLFILLHELGHHELGHLENEKIRPMRYEKIIEEMLSIDQHQEMDADSFAIESLLKPAQVIGTYWHQNAINFFMQLALVSGHPGDAEHPISINRVFHTDSLRAELGIDQDVQPRRQFFEDLAARYRATSRYSSEDGNALINTNREACLDILNEINEVLRLFSVDLSTIWKQQSPSWLDRNEDYP